MPSLELLTPLGREMLDSVPSWCREDPDIRAVVHCHARESERQDEYARQVRDQFIPARVGELGIGWWEALFGMTVAPPGESVEVRQVRVLGRVAQMAQSPRGADWEAAVTALVGPGWTYEEEDPYTIRVTVPFAPGSEPFLRLEEQLRAFTPAHLDIIVQGGAGFVLDQSQLDQEPFHPS